MNTKTQAAMNEMVAHARTGREVIPMFFQSHGRATVSAAIRAAKSRGLLIETGKDGCGKPLYTAPLSKGTHAGNSTIN
jgi:hypothetical protein